MEPLNWINDTLYDKTHPDYPSNREQFWTMVGKRYDPMEPFLRKCQNAGERFFFMYLWDHPESGLYDWHPQHTVYTDQKRRIDFYVTRKGDPNSKRYAVEYDGWEEHYSTKDKVCQTITRTQELLKLGYVVVPFTAMQVASDPVKSARDFYEVANEIYTRGEPA